MADNTDFYVGIAVVLIIIILAVVSVAAVYFSNRGSDSDSDIYLLTTSPPRLTDAPTDAPMETPSVSPAPTVAAVYATNPTVKKGWLKQHLVRKGAANDTAFKIESKGHIHSIGDFSAGTVNKYVGINYRKGWQPDTANNTLGAPIFFLIPKAGQGNESGTDAYYNSARAVNQTDLESYVKNDVKQKIKSTGTLPSSSDNYFARFTADIPLADWAHVLLGNHTTTTTLKWETAPAGGAFSIVQSNAAASPDDQADATLADLDNYVRKDKDYHIKVGEGNDGRISGNYLIANYLGSGSWSATPKGTFRFVEYT